MGSDPIALPVLEVLRDRPEVELLSIYTQPDRPSGRGKKLSPNAIKTWGQSENIAIYQPEKLDISDEQDIISQGADLLIVMAYGHILKKSLLDALPLGVWNFHTSLLPKFRGASPIQSAIAAGEKTSGVTLMQIEPRMDAGAIVAQKTTPITSAETGASLYQKLALLSGELMDEQLATLLSDSVPLQAQDDASASYCHKLSKKDGAVDFRLPVTEISNRIRAFQPWPGAFCSYHTGQESVQIKIGSAIPYTEMPSTDHPAGTIITSTPEKVLVQCGEGILQLLTLQRPGGKMLPVSDFLNGFHLQENSAFELLS